MKRFALVACALSLTYGLAGCNKGINPVVPSGIVTFVAQLSAASNVPAAGLYEAGATGSLRVTMTPTTGGAYTATFDISLANLLRAGVLPVGSGLENGSVIVAGYVQQGAAGSVSGLGPVMVPLTGIAYPQTATAGPVVCPTGALLITIKNVAVSAGAASAIIANPSGFYFNMYSALNQTGMIRGQLILQP